LFFIYFQGFSQIETVKLKEIGLEVMKTDLDDMTMKWYEAKSACEKLGNGWRLPTKKELENLYQLRNKIGGFKPSAYWSSSEYGNVAWTFYFNYGTAYGNLGKDNEDYARAVRTLE
jgi:hypothetical protein